MCIQQTDLKETPLAEGRGNRRKFATQKPNLLSSVLRSRSAVHCSLLLAPGKIMTKARLSNKGKKKKKKDQKGTDAARVD